MVLADTEILYSVKHTRSVSVSMVSVERTIVHSPTDKEGSEVYSMRYSMMIPLWNIRGGGDQDRKMDMKDRGRAMRAWGLASGTEERREAIHSHRAGHVASTTTVRYPTSPTLTHHPGQS